ncbi:ATP-grasp domain-containing protein [Calycomorphotria hydatis]|uniref:Carbamoyl-phosphate synthase arginine-specific large chain n=1 Tax=Calycomorphotria hydatis TaxID=2528027 RepID=A0A517TDA2_9PLAN|nr:ATP-grasp domain-containing protein [Calycomorphotria hydatis]QDT66349.1 Carbamoyl-phosphate synthase arginine-specific large chain [Calycomorphotria hydatis]
MPPKPSILVTGGRFGPSMAVVRGLYQFGARVHVADSYKMSPALHSHAHSTISHVVPAPAEDPIQFVEAVAGIVRDNEIELVVPAFEEGFYLSHYADLIPVPLFAPPFEAIAELHNKARFTELCTQLNLPLPRSVAANNRDELREAVRQFDHFVARPAYSRGGFVYLTNHGPRAGETTIDDCEPTRENPWLVQEFIEGRDACSFSVVREGKIVLHCVYEPTIAAPGGWSIQFSSIADFGTYEKASRIAEHFNYTGFLSFDYRRTAASPDGFVMIECNPRVCAGAFMTPEAWLGPAVLDLPGELHLVEPGKRRQYDFYLLDPHLHKQPAHKLLKELFSAPDAYLKPDDLLPALYFLIARHHFSTVAKQEHTTMANVLLRDVTWDGSPMPEYPGGS